MNSDYLREFMGKLAKDPELTQEFKNASDKGTDEAYKFALEHSDGHFTKEEFEEYMVNLTKEYVELKSKKLEDNLLTNIAGGAHYDESSKTWRTDIDDLPWYLKNEAKEWEEKLKEDNDAAQNRISWIKKSGSITKLTNTVANIGFSIFKAHKDHKNKVDDSEDIKIQELREMVAIKKLENQLKQMGIDDYESLLQ